MPGPYRAAPRLAAPRTAPLRLNFMMHGATHRGRQVLKGIMGTTFKQQWDSKAREESCSSPRTFFSMAIAIDALLRRELPELNVDQETAAKCPQDPGLIFNSDPTTLVYNQVRGRAHVLGSTALAPTRPHARAHLVRPALVQLLHPHLGRPG